MAEEERHTPYLVTLEGTARERAVPVLVEGFEGIYRWHAKRTLRTVGTVRAAIVDREVAGVALLERLVPEAGYVYYLAVARRFRGHGIGGILLDDAIDRFRSQGADAIYGAVEEDNLPSQRLFASRGFRVVERQEKNYREGGLGVEGLRTRMWVVSGERVYGLRLAGPRPTRPE
jgi:ribosomal protein S18 acetylase RimI-like enzyme